MAPRKKATGRKTSSARAKKTDLSVVKGGTAVAETSKKSTAVATIKADSKAEAKETAEKEETKASAAKAAATETKTETAATKATSSETKAKSTPTKATATKIAAEKKTADKLVEKKPAARRGRPKKAEVQKTASRSRKAEEQKTEVHYFEIGDDQVSTEDVVARIKDAYKAEGHQIGRIKKIDVYYNFEERRAYYVINDNAEGKFVEF